MLFRTRLNNLPTDERRMRSRSTPSHRNSVSRCTSDERTRNNPIDDMYADLVCLSSATVSGVNVDGLKLPTGPVSRSSVHCLSTRERNNKLDSELSLKGGNCLASWIAIADFEGGEFPRNVRLDVELLVDVDALVIDVVVADGQG